MSENIFAPQTDDALVKAMRDTAEDLNTCLRRAALGRIDHDAMNSLKDRLGTLNGLIARSGL